MIAVIIAAYQIGERGFDRLEKSLFSLLNQTHPVRIYFVDGGGCEQFNRKADNFKYIKWPTHELNIPILMNVGGFRAMADGAKYLHFTGADFVYKLDYFERLARIIKPSDFYMSPVYMAANGEKFTEQSISDWKGWKLRDNWGDKAPGLQTMSAEFFDKVGGYDERMSGWSGMDDEMIYLAKFGGLDLRYVPFRDVYHIFHPAFKKTAKHLAQSRKNWALRDYVKRNGKRK